MTAAEHLAEADRLLYKAAYADAPMTTEEMTGWALIAIGHALAAIGSELGVPHPAAPAGGAGHG